MYKYSDKKYVLCNDIYLNVSPIKSTMFGEMIINFRGIYFEVILLVEVGWH